MARRLDIGISNYGNWPRLCKTMRSITELSETDWRVFIIDNPDGDPKTREVVADWVKQDSRIHAVLMSENVGYAGAINKLFELAETEYIGYCDNDIQVKTAAWDERLCQLLDRHHEVGWVFPNAGVCPLDRAGQYREVMWCPGFCWVLSRACQVAVGPFDASLGHQEEADYALRVRMAGWKCAAMPDVQVAHFATASNDPKAKERINAGIVKWVNKWTTYFGGKNLTYHSPNTLRWEDWPPNALYLEEYWQRMFPGLNTAPEVVKDGGFEYDLIKVPRRSGYYRGRVI